MNSYGNKSKCFCSNPLSKFYDPSDIELSLKLLENHLASIRFDRFSDKFNYICSILPMEACKLVRDIILKPPEPYSCEILLISLVERSFYLELQNPTHELNQNEISEHKPSKILGRMQDVCKNMDDDGLLPYFCRFLPLYMQSTVCDSSRPITLETFAKFADMDYFDKYLKPKDSPTSTSKYVSTKLLDFNDPNNNLSSFESDFHLGLELLNTAFHSMNQKYKYHEESVAKTDELPITVSFLPEKTDDPREKISVL